MIPSLYASGGMERVLTNKANYLVEKGFEVFIITTNKKNKSCFYHLNNKVKHIDLNINYIDNQNRNIIIKPVYFLMNFFKYRTRLKKL